MNPAFEYAGARPQVALPIAPFHVWPRPDGAVWASFHRLGDDFLLRFPGLADFQVRHDGRSVLAWAAPGIEEAGCHQLYLSQVLPLALSQAGCPVFHASAVVAAGRALAFVGRSGRGKSTLATSLALQGAALLTDDGLLLSSGPAGVSALPGPPALRLWADSEAALLPPGRVLAPAAGYTDKGRFLSMPGLDFASTAWPLCAVFFLGEATVDQVDARRLTPGEAMRGWLAHAFLLDVDAASRLSDNFAWAGRLAEEVPAWQLEYPREFGRLSEVHRKINELLDAS